MPQLNQQATEYYLLGPRQFSQRPNLITEIPPGYALIEMIAGTICGSERKYWKGDKNPGEVCLCHEGFGKVLAVETNLPYKYSDERNRAIIPGDKVALDPLWTCKTLAPGYTSRWCYVCKENRKSGPSYCRNQKFASSGSDGFTRTHLVYPTDLLIHLDSVPDDLGALVEPLSIGVRAANFLKDEASAYSGRIAKQTSLYNLQVGIIGDGPIGLIVANNLHELGISKKTLHLFGLNPAKINLAENISVTHQFYERSIHSLEDSFDFIFECVGYDQADFTLAAALSLLKPEGRVIQLGMGRDKASIPLSSMVADGKGIIGLCKSKPEDMLRAAEKLKRQVYQDTIRALLPVKRVQIHSATDIEEAYRAAEQNAENKSSDLFVKVMMLFGNI